MLLDEAGEVVEMFKNSFPLSLVFFIPIFILISPVSPVGAAHDFAVYRMQHYDLQGSSYGENLKCRISDILNCIKSVYFNRENAVKMVSLCVDVGHDFLTG